MQTQNDEFLVFKRNEAQLFRLHALILLFHVFAITSDVRLICNDNGGLHELN